MVAKKGKVLLVFSQYERVKSQKLNTKVAEISKKKKGQDYVETPFRIIYTTFIE